MKIHFFETKEGFDNRAIKGGVYQIELKGAEGQIIPLYIGESVWITERCGQHLYALYNNPSYFGLTSDDLNNDNLSLVFSVLGEVTDKKSVLGVGKYKDMELRYIKDNNPLTQLNTSDRQIRNINDKVAKVQNEMIRVGMKNRD
ncbi:MAG: hypothetical protein HFE79_13635 [Ruminiclostridium sp.]|nr:hypothetical protein [Ruminiclostridium sp.]